MGNPDVVEQGADHYLAEAAAAFAVQSFFSTYRRALFFPTFSIMPAPGNGRHESTAH